MAFGDYATNGAGTDAGSVTSSSTTFPNTTVSGNSIVVAIRRGSQTGTITVSDNKSNTFVQDATIDDGTGGNTHRFYRASNISGGASHQVTVQFSAAASMRYAIAEYVGNFALDGTPPTGSGLVGSLGPADSGAETTSATDAIIGAVERNGGATAFTAGSGYTSRFAVATGKLLLEDKNGSQAAGSHKATASWVSESGEWTAIMCAYSNAASGATAPLGRLEEALQNTQGLIVQQIAKTALPW